MPGKVNQWLIKIKVLLLTNLFATISGYELSQRSGTPIGVSGIVIVLRIREQELVLDYKFRLINLA